MSSKRDIKDGRGRRTSVCPSTPRLMPEAEAVVERDSKVKSCSQCQQETRPGGDTILNGAAEVLGHQMDHSFKDHLRGKKKFSFRNDHRDQKWLETMKHQN